MFKKSYAKINLSLSIKDRNINNYHNIESVMVSIDLYDILEITINNTMTFSCNRSFIKYNEKNTIYKTIETLRQEYNFTTKFNIVLKKYIPIQAGLAGGSANAATTIHLLDELLHLNMSQKQMIFLARKIGSDVPFCLFNKPALVLNTGETLKFITNNMNIYVLLVKPRKGISSKECFENLDLDNLYRPCYQNIIEALNDNDYNKLINNIGNSLQEQSIKQLDDIKVIIDQLLDLGFDQAIMTGSGSTVLGFSQDINLLNKTCKYYRNIELFSKIVRIIK